MIRTDAMTDYRLLKEILSLKTAPFRESEVMQFLETKLREAAIPFFFDSFGNCVLGVRSESAYLKRLRTRKASPLWLMIAHSDHPGWIAVEQLSRRRIRAQWLGGTATQGWEGKKIWWKSQSTSLQGVGTCVCAEVRPSTSGRPSVGPLSGSLEFLEIELDRDLEMQSALNPSPAVDLFGGWDFDQHLSETRLRKKDSKESNEVSLLHSRVVDDLSGVSAILESFTSAPHPDSIGLVTRSEEVGFVGALLHFKKYLQHPQRKIWGLSLEASRTLPGAEIGGGVILRLGDRGNPFSARPTQYLELLTQQNQILRQRKLMDGGSCEGSVSAAYGFETAALAVPLGNYHNQFLQDFSAREISWKEPSPSERGAPAPELVALSDYAALLKTLNTIGKGFEANKRDFAIDWRNPWKDQVKAWNQRATELQEKWEIRK